MSDTVTIGGLPVAPSANLTGAAKIEVEDSTATSGETTLATLRTKMFAGGTGYTATDPLVVGTITSSAGNWVMAGVLSVGATTITGAANGDMVVGGAYRVSNAGGSATITVATQVSGDLLIGSTGSDLLIKSNSISANVSQKVTAAAANSAGAGFRWLIIPN